MDLTQDQLHSYGGAVIRLSAMKHGSAELSSLLTPQVGEKLALDASTITLPESFFTMSAYARADALWGLLQLAPGEAFRRGRRLMGVTGAVEGPAFVGSQRISTFEELQRSFSAADVDVTDGEGESVDLYRHMVFGSPEGAHGLDFWAEEFSANKVQSLPWIRPLISWSMRESLPREFRQEQRAKLTSLLGMVKVNTVCAND